MDNQLVPLNPTEVEQKFPIVRSELKALATQYKDLTIIGPEDKAGMRAVDAARKVLKAKRTLIRATGKDARDAATKYAKMVIALEDSLVDEIEPTERELEQRYDNVQEEIEMLAQKKQKEEDDRIQGLLNQLRAVEADMDIYELKAITPERFAEVLAEATKVFEKKQAERAEQKAKDDEAARLKEEEDRKAKEKFEEEQKKWREEQAKLEAEKKKLADEAEKIRLDREAIRKQKLDLRLDRLLSLQGPFVQLKENDLISVMPDNEFEAYFNKVASQKKYLADLAEKKRLQDIEDAKQKAIDQEKLRLEKLAWDEAEKVRQGDDIGRFEYLVGKIKPILDDQVFNQMTSDQGKKAVDSVWNLLSKAGHTCRDFKTMTLYGEAKADPIEEKS